jgi:hypothetical protein
MSEKSKHKQRAQILVKHDLKPQDGEVVQVIHPPPIHRIFNTIQIKDESLKI